MVSHGEYGTPEGLQYGFPVSSDGTGWNIVEGLLHDEDGKERIRISTEELVQEKELVKALIPS